MDRQDTLWNKSNVIQKVRMGKKVEKALSKDKNPSSATHVEDDNPNKTPEPYKCIGNFLTDFNELCKQNGMAVIPPVVTRPKPPGPASGGNEGKPDKKGDKNKQPVPEPEPEVELNEDGEPIEPPPKTYSTRDKFEYFKPSVQVELDNNDKWDSVSEIFIRGWKIDTPMMDNFQQSWPTLERLHTINLWYTGLSEDTLHTLAVFLPQCTNIKNVLLDGNPVKEENWAELIGEESLVQNLSLRHCKITDKGSAGLGRALGTAKVANTKLLSLNLTGNDIGDPGAESLAGGLRMNRTLMSLTLTSNKVGDKGVAKISEALSRFPLSHEEVVERRKLISDRGSPERNKSPPPSRRAESKDRPGSVRSMTTQDKTKQKPSAKKKDVKGRDAKEETKTVKKDKEDTRGGGKRAQQTNPNAGTGRMSSASVAAEATKTMGKTKDKKKDKGKSSNQEAELAESPVSSPELEIVNMDSQDLINPLLEVADYMDGQLWIAGNRTLINLNLARNNISETGMSSLLKAIQYQTTLTSGNRSGGTGLMRLVINKNSVRPENEVMAKLSEKMMLKDPFYKPPITPEGETA
ncbi:leucine-rich repeat-containing protein 71 isoform X4 [Aplysia californica]|uniref:Leucine-rich repeat-containing protein 71 isoform X4 n=1 Tax=Aplysia californica TaxID=6500 RepID=A0ABM0K113_APLCA|nr:leucine-rich repeat-containing protein 71 isoform X4 [Aplysia californica]